MRKLSTSKGVTLIELLVVVVVIGVLASVVLMVINPLTQFKKGRDTRRKSDLAQIQSIGIYVIYPSETPLIYKLFEH